MSVKTLPIFDGVTMEQIDELLEETRQVQAAAGTALFRRSNPAKEVWFVARGRARVHVDALELAVLDGPCVIGELELLTGGPPAADVTAVDEVRAFAMTNEAFRRRLSSRDAVAAQMLWNISRQVALRLTAMDEKIIRMLAGAGAAELKDMAQFRKKLWEWSA